MIYYAIQPSIFQSPMVRRSGSKLVPTFTIGRPERANFDYSIQVLNPSNSRGLEKRQDSMPSQCRHQDGLRRPMQKDL